MRGAKEHVRSEDAPPSCARIRGGRRVSRGAIALAEVAWLANESCDFGSGPTRTPSAAYPRLIAYLSWAMRPTD